MRVAPASEPASASVSPNAPSTSPAIIGTRYSCFCASVPRVEERRRAEAHAGLERDRHRRVDPRDLLDRDAVREVVGAAAAVLLAGTADRTGRACPSRARCRPGTRGRGPSPRRAARSRASAKSRTTARNCSCSGLRLELHGPTVPASTTVARARTRRSSASSAPLPSTRATRSCATVDHWIVGERPTARRSPPAAPTTFDALRRDRRAAASGSASRVRRRPRHRAHRDPHRRRPRISPTSRSSRFDARARDPRRRRPRARRRSRRSSPTRSGARADAIRSRASPASTRGRRASTASTTRAACGRVHELLARRRVLPGEPHPPAHVRRRARSARALRRARAR